MDGVDVIRALRGWTRVPIVVLSGRTQSLGKVRALDAGADDYVTKPFHVDELVARVRAVGRRVATNDESQQPIVHIGDTTIDLPAHRVTTTRICGSTWPNCDASSSPILPGPVTCSLNPVWTTGSSHSESSPDACPMREALIEGTLLLARVSGELVPLENAKRAARALLTRTG